MWQICSAAPTQVLQEGADARGVVRGDRLGGRLHPLSAREALLVEHALAALRQAGVGSGEDRSGEEAGAIDAVTASRAFAAA